LSGDPSFAPESTERLAPGRARTISDGGVNDRHDDSPGLRRGESVGRYVVVDRIGAGAMGVVYSAYDPDLDRRVALKLLVQASTAGIDRMVREAQAAAKVVHPNVVAVHDVGTHGARMFVAMELVEGQSLAQWLDGEPRPWREVLAMAIQAGRGLAAAHAVGIVHRDFKPDNVLVGRDGRARVADFGLARAIDRTSGDAELPTTNPSALTSGALQLTATGALLGTPAYMAPEQHLREPCDARADQFSFCVASWEALWGRRPFRGDSLHALALAVTEGQIELPEDPRGVPTRVRAVLLRGLSTAPADRFAAMDDLLDALTLAQQRRRGGWWLGLAVLVGGGGLTLAALRDDAREDPCATTASPAEQVWNADARARLTDAFTATALPFASDVARSIVTRLDNRVEHWTAQWVEVCVAARDELPAVADGPLLQRRRACLDDRQRELVAALELLDAADAKIVQQAFEVVGGVRDVERCADPEALRRRIDPPPAELMLEVSEIRAEIERALVVNRAGRISDAEALLDQLEARAQATAWPPITIELALARTNLSRSDTAPRAEIPRLRVAFDRSLEIGDDLAAVGFATELAWQIGYRDHRAAEALEWIGTSWALLHRSGGDWLLEVHALNNEAVIRADSREFDQAETLFDRALALAIEHDADGLRPLQLRANLAAFVASRGDHARALELLQASLDGYRALLGDAHPRVADIAGNLGINHMRMGDIDSARASLELATSIQDRSVPPDHPARESVLSARAECEYLDGKLEVAVALMRRVDAIRTASYGEKSSRTIDWRLYEATRMLELDPAPAAEIDALVASATAAADAFTEPQLQLDAHALRVAIAVVRGRVREAGAEIERVRELLAAHDLDPEHELAAQVILADAELARGDRAAARAALVEVDRWLGAPLRPRHEVASSLLRAAELRTVLDGDTAAALPLARRAHEVQIEVGTDRTGLPARIDAWLAAATQ
jgi:eukaryotic-like serine/threonine-protein kinase